MRGMACVLLSFCSIVVAFVAPSATHRPRSDRCAFDPISSGLGDVLGNTMAAQQGIIAVASAAAGALSQLPRIQELEAQLVQVQSTLNATQTEMTTKVALLEDKLYTLDTEYEAQTTRFKKQYELKLRDDLARMTEKIKTDYEFKLAIKVEEQKGKLLDNQLDLVGGITGKRQAEMVELRLKQSRMEETNQQLEKALREADAELEALREAAAKKPWWKRML